MTLNSILLTGVATATFAWALAIDARALPNDQAVASAAVHEIAPSTARS